MSESYPNPSFESESNQPNKSAGKGSVSKKENAPGLPRPEMGPSRPEQKQPAQRSAAELAGVAMRENQEQIEALRRSHEHEERKKEEKSDDSSSRDSKKLPEAAVNTEQVQGADEVKDHGGVTATSQEVTHKDESQNEEPKPAGDTEKRAQRKEREAEPVDVELPQVAQDSAEPQSFEDFVREHTELADLDAEDANEQPVPVQEDAFTEKMHHEMSKEFAEATSGDALTEQRDEFTDFVEGHPELANLDDGSGQSVDAEAQSPEANTRAEEDNTDEELAVTGGAMPPRPPLPPTAEGASYGEDEPEPGSFGSAMPPDPNLVRDPWMPVGDTLNPAVIGAISAVEARQRVDSLRHTARERGLAGAVGILGLGLVVEHFLAKRRDKKQQRQINEQGKQLRETNQAFEDERRRRLLSEQEAGRKIEALTSGQERTNEQLRRTQEVRQATRVERRPGLTRAEVAIGGGLIGGAAATELAAKVAGRNAEGRPLTSEELQERAKQDPELARALAVNQANRLAESASVVTRSEVMRELSHERPQDKTSDTARNKPTRSVVAGTNVGSGLPSPERTAVNTPMPQYAAEMAKAAAKHEAASRLGKPWTWVIIGFILLALLAGALAA